MGVIQLKNIAYDRKWICSIEEIGGWFEHEQAIASNSIPQFTVEQAVYFDTNLVNKTLVNISWFNT